MKVLFVLLFSLTLFAETPLERTVDSVVSVFENSSTSIRYQYIEHLHDGRGYTAGKVGFTTGTGDLYDLVQHYHSKKPNSPFKPLMAVLKKRADDASSSVSGLEKLPAIWKKACSDDVFIESQDEMAEELYKIPAREQMRQFNVSSALGYLIFYDTIVQHGNGDDPDSFHGVVKKMGPHNKDDEGSFLHAFLESRKKVLTNPSDSSTTDEWRQSVDRVNALSSLLQEGRWDLKLPFTVTVWDSKYQIKE